MIVNILNFLFWGPGLLSSLCCVMTISLLFKLHPRWYHKAGFFISCMLLSGMIIYVGDLYNLIPTFFIFIAGIFLCCEGSIYKKLTLGFMLCTVAFSFNALCDTYLPLSLYVQFGFIRELLRLLFWVLLFFLFLKLSPGKSFELPPSYWKLLLLLSLTPLGIVLCVVLLQEDSVLTHTSAYPVNISLLLIALLSQVGLLMTAAFLNEQQKLSEKQHLLTLNLNYYKNMEQQQFEIRKLRHDMANHLQTLSSLPPDQVSSYLHTLSENAAFTSTVTYCGDNTINAVLNDKAASMKQNQIVFHYQLDIEKTLEISPCDLCTVFANALDNSIEACKKLPEKKRQIDLEARAARGLLAIQIKNPLPPDFVADTNQTDVPFMDTVHKKTGLFATTKKDASLHGYGLKSILEITKRLNGNMEIKTEEGSFCLFLYLPLN